MQWSPRLKPAPWNISPPGKAESVNTFPFSILCVWGRLRPQVLLTVPVRESQVGLPEPKSGTFQLPFESLAGTSRKALTPTGAGACNVPDDLSFASSRGRGFGSFLQARAGAVLGFESQGGHSFEEKNLRADLKRAFDVPLMHPPMSNPLKRAPGNINKRTFIWSGGNQLKLDPSQRRTTNFMDQAESGRSRPVHKAASGFNSRLGPQTLLVVAVAQFGRAPGCESGRPGFESQQSHFRDVAQPAERTCLGRRGSGVRIPPSRFLTRKNP